MRKLQSVSYNPNNDYYKLFDLSTTANSEDIRRAFRKRAKEVHPDHNPDRQEWAHKQFQQLNEAQMILTDSTLRAEYDRKRLLFLAGRSGSTTPPRPSGTYSSQQRTNYNYTPPRSSGAQSGQWKSGRYNQQRSTWWYPNRNAQYSQRYSDDEKRYRQQSNQSVAYVIFLFLMFLLMLATNRRSDSYYNYANYNYRPVVLPGNNDSFNSYPNNGYGDFSSGSGQNPFSGLNNNGSSSNYGNSSYGSGSSFGGSSFGGSSGSFGP